MSPIEIFYLRKSITILLLFVQLSLSGQSENQKRIELIRLKLEQRFEFVSDFDSTSLIAIFSKGNDQYGYIDTSGEELKIKTPKGVISHFSFINGFALFECSSNSFNTFYVIDKKGSIITKLENLTSIREWKNIDRIIAADRYDKHGVIDRKGKVIVPFNYYLLESIDNKLLRAYVGEKFETKVGVINYNNEMIVPAIYDQIFFYNHSAKYLLASRSKSLVAIKGDKKTEVKNALLSGFSSPGDVTIDFNEGLILNKTMRTNVVYNLRLDTIAPVTQNFDQIDFISEGIIGVRNWLNKKYDSLGRLTEANGCEFSYLTKEGLAISKTIFGDGTHFTEGLSSVRELKKSDGLYGFLNKKGTLQIPCMFSKVTSFRNGYAKVQKGNRFFVIDKHGKYVMDTREF